MTRKIFRSAFFFALIACLSLGSACAKKKDAAAQEAAAASGEQAAGGEAAAPAAGSEEEDIPAGNRGTLDSEGKVRESAASGSTAAGEGAVAERAAGGAGGKEAGDVLVEPVHFAFDSSELDSSARDTLAEVKKILEENPSWMLTLEGHCDERGTEDYNMALGQRRASSAKSHLQSLGVPRSRLDTVSFGESRPVDSSGTEDGYAKNRRVEFAFSKAKSS
ncbi:MAG: OmpA family protein [Bdellovibrionota bacterium]